MPTNNYDIAIANDDWYINSTTGRIDGSTLLTSAINNIISPNFSSIAYGDIDTSAIPTTDEITAATLYIYLDSYTATRGVTKEYRVQMLSADETTYVTIHTATFTSAGWVNIPLTSSELALIDKGSGQKTRVRIAVSDPGAFKFRDLDIRAYEYSPSDTYDMYLSVTHAPPSELVPTRTLLGAGL